VRADQPALSPGAAKLLENLRKSVKNRPKKLTTLMSHVANFIGKDKPEAERGKAIKELQKAGNVTGPGHLHSWFDF
jgi:hypothetical protein